MTTSTLPDELREWAGIYSAMARRGFGQAEVDEMELWVIAEVLDVNAEAAATVTGTVTAAQHEATSADLIRQRLAAARSGGPAPTPPPSAGPHGMLVTDAMVAGLAARRAGRAEGEE